eukprot:GSChrysophyteH1.ASY1.ANO1.2559.1 assembled CDS
MEHRVKKVSKKGSDKEDSSVSGKSNNMVVMKNKSWFSFEGIVYIIHLLFFFGHLVPTVGGRIRSECEGYYGCSRFLRQSSFGYTVDLADGQWRDLRGTFPLLWATLAATSVGHWLISSASVSIWFRLIIGMVFVTVMHGYQALIVLVLSYVGYRLAHWQKDLKLSPRGSFAVTWMYAIFILFFKESYRIQHYSRFQFLRPLFSGAYGGMYRWQMPANFLILRIVSYNLDFMWARHEEQQINTAKVGTSEESVPLTRSNLADQSRPLVEYDLPTYFSYILYCPLYIAGPIMSFNAYVSNTNNPQRSEDPLKYAGRWLLCLAVMEYMSCHFPFFAVIHSGLFPHLAPGDLAIVCYILLKMMWLKFLLTWRFFRLWALADGTLPPENMLRCMSNNCSLETFWRGWHASFNKWIVRYLYKPLGGRHNRVYSVWPIFLFVALWHDLEWKLVAWGLLNGSFFVLEVVAKNFRHSKIMTSLPSNIIRLVCVLSGATYILVLIAVNLTGYAIGTGGVGLVLTKLLTWDGVIVLLLTYYLLAMAVSFMSFLEAVGWTSKQE